jgi:hypothetical protein
MRTLDLQSRGRTINVRLDDLALIEERIRRYLPSTILLPRDLRDAALGRVRHAIRLIGPVTIEALSCVRQFGDPLIAALTKELAVEWHAPLQAETDWFRGLITRPEGYRREGATSVVSCADPHHEVVESTAANVEAREVQSGFAAELCDRYGFGRRAKPDQHSRGIYRLWHGSAGTARREAFLRSQIGWFACAAGPTLRTFIARRNGQGPNRQSLSRQRLSQERQNRFRCGGRWPRSFRQRLGLRLANPPGPAAPAPVSTMIPDTSVAAIRLTSSPRRWVA